MARISAHLLWLGTHALDLGAATVFFHTFRDREPLYYLMEWLTGARLTTSYTRVGGLSGDMPDGWIAELRRFVDYFPPDDRRVRERSSPATGSGCSGRRTWA